MTARFIARQLRLPTGFMGRIVGRMMNRRNLNMNRYAVEQLELRASDRVLEIGFGGGVALPLLLAGAAHVSGLDRSAEMVRRARASFSGAVAQGRAEFREGNVEALPFLERSFDKACTVNTVYFWSSLGGGFQEIHRVLRPGGCLAAGFLPREGMERMNMPGDIFTLRTPEEVMAAMTAAGFADVRVRKPRPATAWNVVVGRR